jgi:hypothetical protein
MSFVSKTSAKSMIVMRPEVGLSHRDDWAFSQKLAGELGHDDSMSAEAGW